MTEPERWHFAYDVARADPSVLSEEERFDAICGAIVENDLAVIGRIVSGREEIEA